MAAKKRRNQERRERLAEIEAGRRRAERRRSLFVAVIVLLVVVGLVTAAAVGLRNATKKTDAGNTALDGVQPFANLTRNHVAGAIDYPQSPPVGGDHNPVWLNCGIYSAPVPSTSAVHSLEHGAVWVSYQPDLPSDQVSTLDALAAGNDYLIVSPYPGQGAAVIATAWGLQLRLDSATDPRLQAFLTKYLQGPQTPEPGAPCTGGIGG